jgi:hypothetical protein
MEVYKCSCTYFVHTEDFWKSLICQTSVVLIVFDGVLCEVLNYTVTVAQHESGTRKAISWSVTVYNKTLSSKCNLIAEIKPVQDKECYLNLSLFIANFLFSACGLMTRHIKDFQKSSVWTKYVQEHL